MQAGGSKLPFVEVLRLIKGARMCTSSAATTCVVLALFIDKGPAYDGCIDHLVSHPIHQIRSRPLTAPCLGTASIAAIQNNLPICSGIKH